MRFKAVLLDLDGTLVDTIADIADAVNAMLGDLGMPSLPLDTVRSYVGKGSENLVIRALSRDNAAVPDSDQRARALAIYFQHYRRLNGQCAQVYPGVMPGLQAFQNAGLKMAVVTNKPREFAETLLARTDLAHFFDAIVGGDTCERQKPDPMPVVHACKLLGVAPADALLIGDSVNDAQAARAAGSPVLIVPYGYNEGHDVRSLDVDDIVSSIEQAALWATHKQQPKQTT